MKLGEAARSILTKNGKTPISEKYLYRESQGLWFIVSVLERIETEEHVSLKLRIEDILWRKGRHDIGDSFICSCSKSNYYPIWQLQFLKVALFDFMDFPNILKTKEKYSFKSIIPECLLYN